jgi:hypothetical protein
MLLVGVAVQAQPLRVFSEFARIGPNGEPQSPENPREILSPAVPRNAYATFQLVVKPGQGNTANLWIGQNPENSFRVNLYREQGGKLIPTAEPVEIKNTEVLWLDVFVSRATPVARIKLEPELYLKDDWVIYPMEIRVAESIVPDSVTSSGTASAMDVMRSFACGKKLAASPAAPPSSPANLIFRNALQDVQLATSVPKAELQKRFGACDGPEPSSPEYYLRIRDLLVHTH